MFTVFRMQRLPQPSDRAMDEHADMPGFDSQLAADLRGRHFFDMPEPESLRLIGRKRCQRFANRLAQLAKIEIRFGRIVIERFRFEPANRSLFAIPSPQQIDRAAGRDAAQDGSPIANGGPIEFQPIDKGLLKTLVSVLAITKQPTHRPPNMLGMFRQLGV